jgi:hypothetical protein
MTKASDERKRRIAAAIEACRDEDGLIQPQRVYEAAKDPDNDLHAEFDWDVDRAAHVAWLARARELIREVRHIVVYGKRQVAVPSYVPSPRTTGYMKTVTVAKNAALKKAALQAELDRIRGAIQRAHSLAIAFGLEARFETMLRQVVEVELALDEAAA